MGLRRSASEGRIGAGLGAVGSEAIAAQVFVEAMDLVAVASLEQIEDVMEEVVDLHDSVVTEPRQRDAAGGWEVGAGRGSGHQVGARVHCSSAMACCTISSGRWLSPLCMARRMAVHRMRPASRGRPLAAWRRSSAREW